MASDMEIPLLDEFITYGDLSNDTCQICFGKLVNEEYLNLSFCDHNFHYTCLPLQNLYKKPNCPFCETKIGKIILKTSDHITTDIKSKMNGNCYEICQTHRVNSEIKGFSTLFGWHMKQSNKHILKFKLHQTSHSCYILYSNWKYPEIIDKSQLSKVPFFVRKFKYKVTWKLDLEDEDVSQLEVIPIVVKDMDVIIVKVILVDGMDSERMPGILHLKEIATQLPLK